MGLDPPLGQLRRQTPQRKRPRADPRPQPLSAVARQRPWLVAADLSRGHRAGLLLALRPFGHARRTDAQRRGNLRSEEHTSELQSLAYLVCRLLLEKKKNIKFRIFIYTNKNQTKTHKQ